MQEEVIPECEMKVVLRGVIKEEKRMEDKPEAM